METDTKKLFEIIGKKETQIIILNEKVNELSNLIAILKAEVEKNATLAS